MTNPIAGIYDVSLGLGRPPQDTRKSQPTPQTVYTDRSRQIAYQKCPRYRWLHYHEGGRGIARVSMVIPLATGSAVHKGQELILKDVRDLEGGKYNSDPGLALPQERIESAISEALKEYQDEVAARRLEIGDNESQDFVVAEQSALIEGLLRAWVLVRLPKLRAEYWVLDVELEQVVELVPPQGILYSSATGAYGGLRSVLHQSRTDATLLSRASNDVFILSTKTAKQWGDKNDKEATHDVQGLGELWALESLMAEEWKRFQGFASLTEDFKKYAKVEQVAMPWRFFSELSEPPQVAGILMEVYLKGGRWRSSAAGGELRQYSPFCRAWKQHGPTPDLDQYAWTYEWDGPDFNPTTQRLVHHKLGKGWVEVNPWKDFSGGTKAWVEALARTPAPGHQHSLGQLVNVEGSLNPQVDVRPEESVLVTQFIAPPPYNRLQADVEGWVEQTRQQEREVAEDVANINELNAASHATALNLHFRQHRRSCHWPTDCEMLDACWDGVTRQQGYVESGRYVQRTPHHEAERERFEA